MQKDWWQKDKSIYAETHIYLPKEVSWEREEMPVTLHVPIRRLSQSEFGGISFEVMKHVFAIHKDLGRFFDESIYKCELANRVANVRLEEPIDITFDSFKKRLFIDVLVADGGLFEFKAVNVLANSHRAQLLQYLMLCGLSHGKLINVRPETVEHEFVNCRWQYEDRIRFEVSRGQWNAQLPGAALASEAAIALLRDLGMGLGVSLYEEAIAYLLTGSDQNEADVPVRFNGRQLGLQRFRLIAPSVAVKVTAFDQSVGGFELHARRLLSHVELRAIVWMNIGMKKVIFTTLER